MAVLSIDPSSPFRGGALLGDRIRLTEHFLDPGVFIRSMATRGALGGLAEAALQAALLMDAAGRDDVFLETVGVGQAEVDVIDHADSVVLVLIPGSGDSIQALKAGVMEIPDIIVVNKSDHPLTDTMVREIKGVLTLAPQGSWPVPIVKTEAHRGEGVEELAAKLAEHRAHVEAEGTLSERRRRNLMNEVLGLATVRLRRALEATLARTPRSASCSTRWSPGGWTRPAPRARSSPAGRSRPATPRAPTSRRRPRRVGGSDAQRMGSRLAARHSRSGSRPRSASSASCARRAPGCARTRWSASAPRCSRSPAATGSPTCSPSSTSCSTRRAWPRRSRRASASSAAG